jgi:lysophospholipase L1-like esterase
MSTLKNIFLNFLLLLFGTIIALAMIEVTFRIISKPGKQWYDRPKFYYLAEQSYSMQGQLHGVDKNPNAFRIAVVGDSYTFAPYMQFDDTFSARLERMLNLNTTEKKGEVLNYGVPRYSTSHEVAVVKRAVQQEHADAVLLEITLNDPELKPYRPQGMIIEKNRFGALITNDHENWLFHYWKTLGFVAARLHNSQTHREYKEYFLKLFEDKKGMKVYTDSLIEIRDICKAANVPLVAVVFPLFGIPLDQTYPFFPIHEKTHAILKELGIPSLDLFKPFEGVPHDRMQVMPGEDFHPNEIAHRMAAEELYRFLLVQNIIPKDLQIRKIFHERSHIKEDKSAPFNLLAEEALPNKELESAKDKESLE